MGERRRDSGKLSFTASNKLSAGRFWNSSWTPERNEICKSRLYFEEDEVWRDASTVKRKVGLLPEDEEILDLKSWFAELPVDTKVRLDPNQSWSVSVLRKWIDAFYEEKKIEFIEQPLPHAQIDEIFEMAIDSPIPFALDESVVALGDLHELEKMKWNGYFIIKPSLLSDWPRTIEFIRKNPSKSVLSTVFESPFGYEALLRSCTFLPMLPELKERSISEKPKNLRSITLIDSRCHALPTNGWRTCGIPYEHESLCLQ